MEMSDIPLETCREILLRLPVESLLRFRAVCKGWRAVIDDPCFVKAHANNQLASNTLLIRNTSGPPFYPIYYFDLDALNFTSGPQTVPVTPLTLTRGGLSRLQDFPVAACNGLMLITAMDSEEFRLRNSTWDGKGTWEIWNVLTHEHLKLPELDIGSPVVGYGPDDDDWEYYCPKVVGYGFGYDCDADDYKVVALGFMYHNGEFLKQTHVYSLRSDSWRKIGYCPFDGYSMQKGVFLNGALHWVTDYEIVVLDIGTEKYHQLKLPAPLGQKPILLDALGGCLFLSYCYGEHWCRHFDAWVMNDYGTEDSWVKLFSLYRHSFDRDLRAVAYMKNKMQVLLQHYYGFLWFDVENNSVKTVGVHGLSGYFSAQICVGSLFRLHDSCGSVAAKRRTRKRESKRKMKMADTKLTFCVRDYDRDDLYRSFVLHDSCFGSDSNWDNSTSGGDE